MAELGESTPIRSRLTQYKLLVSLGPAIVAPGKRSGHPWRDVVPENLGVDLLAHLGP